MSADIIDTNIVEMKFDSRQFINDVNVTKLAVDELKDSLNFDSNSFDALKRAAANIDLSSVASNIESLSDRFSTFGIVGMTAIQRITNEVMTLSGKLVGLLAKPWQQIISGGTSRAANIGQAKFQLEGLFGKDELGLAKLNMTMAATTEEIKQLANVTEDMAVCMNAADYAVADTAYGLDSAAKAASVLATSGVDVLHFSEDLADANGLMRTEMQVALRSISGTAAMANASYDDIAQVFERISGNGRVMAIDLNSLASRGLNAAATLRDYLNEIGETTNATEEDIRNMCSKGEISFMTFAKAMDNAYGDHAKDANNTFSGAFSNMKFALSKIGADFISPLRTKVVPLFNDIRMSINQVRKALNFKIHFPGLEEEISVVELFVKAITSLTNKAHDLFNVWMGGQDVLEKAMSGFSKFTDVSFGTVKTLFDDVKNGVRDDANAIDELMHLASAHGKDLSEVFAQLGETFGKTEEEIKEMCRNGTISFEDFYKAVSAVYGNLVNDTRIEQIATIFRNVLRGMMNIGNAIATFVGPAIKGFFEVFTGSGVNGVIQATESFMNFTDTLKASAKTQTAIYNAFKGIASITKVILTLAKKLAVSILTIAGEISPLFSVLVQFAAVIVGIVSRLVEIIAESKMLSSVTSVLVNILSVAVYLLVNVVTLIFEIAEPAIKAVAEVFAALSKGLASIDISSLNLIIDRFRTLIYTISNGGLVTSLKTFIDLLFGSIEDFFKGVNLSFAYFCEMLENVAKEVATLCDRIITILSDLKSAIVRLFTSLRDFIAKLDFKTVLLYVEQVVGFVAMVGLATTLGTLGKGIRGLSRYLNAEALVAFTTALKSMARAVLEFSVALLLLSSIPADAIPRVTQLLSNLTVSLAILLGVYALLQIQLAKINANIFGNKIVKFFNNITKSLNNFLITLGRSSIIVSVGIALLALAGAVLTLFKSIQLYNGLKPEEWANGFQRVLTVLSVLFVFLAALVIVSKPSNHIGNGSTALMVGSGNGGLMGAAVTLLALIIVLREFEKIIDEYNSMNINEEELKHTLFTIANVMVILAGSVAVMGLTTKKAATGMIAASIAMLSFLIVVRQMESIILEYKKLMAKMQKDLSDGQHWWDPLILMAGVLITLTVAIAVMARAVAGANKSVFKFKNDDIMNFGFGGKSQRTPLFGMVAMLLSLAILMKTLESVVVGLNGQDVVGYVKTLALLITILSGVVATTYALKNVSAKNVFGLTAFLVAIGLMISILSFFDARKVLGSAVAISAVILAVAGAMKIMESTKINPAVIVHWIVGLIALGSIGSILKYFASLDIDWKNVLAFGIGIGSCLAGLALAMKYIEKAKFNAKNVFMMATMFLAIASLMVIIDNIPINDPWKILALSGAVTLIGMAMAAIAKVIGKAQISANWKTILATFGGIALALSALITVLAFTGSLFSGNVATIIGLTIGIDLLIPMMIVMEHLISELGKLNASRLKKGAATVAVMMGIIALFANLLAAAGSIASGGNWYSIPILSVSMDLMIPLLIVMEHLISELGKLNPNRLLKGTATIGAMMLIVSIFTMLVAAAGTIGDSANTVSVFNALTLAMGSLISFIVVTSIVVSLMGLLVGSQITSGLIGFGGIMAIIGIFAILIANAANIGDVNNTMILFNGLSNALMSLIPLILTISLVSAILGIILATGAGAIAFIAGFAAISAILVQISTFTKSLANIANIGDVNNTLLLMTSLGDALMSMIPLIATLALVSSVLSVVTPLIAVGMIAFNTILDCIVNMSTLIAALGTISPIIYSGTEALNTIIDSLARISVMMGFVDIPSLLKFVVATATMTLINVSGLYKLFLASSSLLISGNNYALMGLNSSSIIRGISTSIAMIQGLYKTSSMLKDFIEVDTAGLVQSANDLLETATIVKSIGEWVSVSLSRGVLEPEVLQKVAQSGYIVSKVLEESIRDTMQVHSYSPLYGGIGGFVPTSEATGMLNNSGVLMDAGSDMMSMFGGSMSELAGDWGEISGSSFVTSMGEVIADGLSQILQNYKDLGAYFFGDDEAAAAAYQRAIQATSPRASSNRNSGNNIYNFKDEKEYLEYLKDPDKFLATHSNTSSSISDSGIFGFDTFIEDMIKGITETVGDLGSIGDLSSISMDGLADSIGDVGSSSSSASKNVNKLQDTIDDLIEDYEERFDTAKERANKDLFKGVEVQGKNFLDEISDIMKEYEKIYTNAVERTNSQDLFAEVNDEEESFAPETLLNNLEDQVNQVNELNTIIASLSGRITDNNLRAAIANMDVDDLPQLRAMYRMTGSQLADYEKMYQEKVLANQNKIQNELSGNLSQLTGEYTNVASYVASDGITNVMLNNMQLQIDKVNEYNDTINSLMSRVTDMNLREAIATMGIDSLDELKRLNAMTDNQLDQYVAMYNQKIIHETTSIEHELSAKLGAALGEPIDIATFYEAYKAGMTQFTDFVKTDESGSKAAGKAAGQTIASGVSEGVKDSYSADEAYETGKAYTESLAKGMSDPTAIVFLETTVDGLISMILEPLQNSYPNYKDSGMQVVSNLLEGVTESIDAGFDETLDGVTSRIIATFEECGDDYAQCGHDIINNLCRGIDEGIDPEMGFEDVIDNIINRIIDTFEQSYVGEDSEISQVGHNIVNALCRGIDDAKKQGFTGTFKDMVVIMLNILSMNNTYEDYYECGHTIIHEFCKGLEDALDAGFEGSVRLIVSRISSVIHSQENIIMRIGEFISFGLAKGMRTDSAIKAVENAAKSVAIKAVKAAKATLDSHSPSRVFMEIGKFVDEGFAIGMREYAGLAEEEAGNMANGSISAVQDAINQLSGMLDGTIDVNPTITPTLDLSQVNAKSAALADMFNGRQVAVQAQADEQQAAMMNQLGTILAEQNAEPKSVVFNQTNNSPKALSTGEIYRQTRNGFSRLVSAVT